MISYTKNMQDVGLSLSFNVSLGSLQKMKYVKKKQSNIVRYVKLKIMKWNTFHGSTTTFNYSPIPSVLIQFFWNPL